jgi:hypothetical protein
LIWDDEVGRRERSMRRLPRRRAIALAVACVVGAFSRMEAYLAESVPKRFTRART